MDFGIKLLSDSAELYAKGTLTGNDELELVTKDLNRLEDDIIATTESGLAQSSTVRQPPSKDEEAVLELAASCKEIGGQLLALLVSLKVPRWGNVLEDSLASFRKALRSAKTKGRIRNLERRLKMMQSQLNTNVLAILEYIVAFFIFDGYLANTLQ